MDRPDDREVRTRTGATPRLIGIIGKTVLNDQEKASLRWIGRAIARLGHHLAYIPAKGTSDQLREGVEAENGETQRLDTQIIETADHTLIYPDQRLLSRLRNSYPNLDNEENVSVIDPPELPLWIKAIEALLNERGITSPPR